MKTKFITILSLLALFVVSCQQIDPVDPLDKPDPQNPPILSVTASFIGDDSSENSFPAVIDHENLSIYIAFPYYYPVLSANELKLDDIKKVRVKPSLNTGCILNPGVTSLDLTKENILHVIDPKGNEFDYTLTAAIVKSSAKDIISFIVSAQILDEEQGVYNTVEIDGLVDPEKQIVQLPSIDVLDKLTAEVKLSPNATISPDPSVEFSVEGARKFFTVTAHDGSTSEWEIIKSIPPRKSSGVRIGKGSPKVIWTKKLSEIGCTTTNAATGVAVTDKFVVVNEMGVNQAVYLNLKTGEVEGYIDVSDITNDYVTSDNAGNVIFNNRAASGEVFNMWKLSDFSKQPELLHNFVAGAGLGNKVSIVGDVNGNAMISSHYSGFNGQFARMQIKDGQFVNASPVLVNPTEIGQPWANCDVVFSDPNDPESDYFLVGYCTPRGIQMIDGTTNLIKANSEDTDDGSYSNYIRNAIDCITFNKAKYVFASFNNSFTWGAGDMLNFYDVTSIAGRSIDNAPFSFGADGLNINGNFGANAIGGSVNANGYGDVKLHASADGNFLYLVAMWANGSICCIQLDCFDI